MRPRPAYTVVYDGNCRVCTRFALSLRARDRAGQFEIVSSQTPGVPERFPWIPATAYADELQLIATDGTTWAGAAAIEQMLRVLPRWRAIAWVFHVPFVRGLADRFYRWFARNRYQFGCGDHCPTRPPTQT
jgi:predicted DCC family thiol-disulfide oxidoreductase YuxK